MASIAREKLEALLNALARCRGEETPHREAHFQNMVPKARLLYDAPLIHVMKNPGYTAKALRMGKLVPRASLGLPPLPHEEFFGLGEPVYTSAGVVYPSRETALIFRPAAEDGAKVEASPWDSGAFYKGLCPDLTKGSDEHRKRFTTWTLPAPEYREYLVHFVASCFDQTQDYVRGRPHLFRDPLDVLDASRWESRVFEVRFQRLIPINQLTLLAVFVPKWIMTVKTHEELIIDLTRLRDRGVSVVYYHSDRQSLQQEARNWLAMRMNR